MRVVTARITNAWRKGERLVVGNTRTDGLAIYLHGNKIAERRPDGSVWVTDCGWPTHTTRERLNGIFRSLDLNTYASQKAFTLHLTVNGSTAPWDGQWLRVK